MLQLAQGGGQDAGEGVFAGAGEQQAEGEEQFGESVFEATLANVVAVRVVNDEDCAEHDDDYTDSADAEERADEDGDAASELSQTHQITGDHGHFHECREALRARAAEHAKQDGAAVVDEGERASDAHDEEFKIQLTRNVATEGGRCAHENLPFVFRRLCIKSWG